MVTVRPLRNTDEVEWLRLRRALWPDHEVDELELENGAHRSPAQQVLQDLVLVT